MGDKGSLQRLQFCNFKLDVLLEITLAINANNSIDQLLTKFEHVLMNELNIGKVLLYRYNEKWDCILSTGVHRSVKDSINVHSDLIYYRQITNLSTALNKNLELFDVIIPVYHNEMAIAYLIIGDIDEERAGISPTIKHLHFIQTLTNIIIVAIENKRLYKENVKQEAIKKELELASKMQTMLIPNPSKLPNNERIHVSAYYLPHFEVGGDYYDFMRLSDNEYGFCIADVSGKGISAALLMSNFQANIRAYFTARISLEETVRKLNERVMENANGEKFITLFIGKYNTDTHFLEFINAGHNPPILVDKHLGINELLFAGSVGVGMFDEIPKITVGKRTVSPGAKLVCYTDGIAELENSNGVQFGTDIMAECVAKDVSIRLIIDTIIEKLDVHRGNNNYFDDISIIGMEFH